MRRDLWLALAASALLLALAWGEPRPNDDLFITLAGGREALAGRLGTPDDWSYTTAGRVWLQQSWGSGVLLHAANTLAGEPGLLALKATLLAAGTLGLALAARARGVNWALALLIGALPWAAIRSEVALGPSLVHLVIASAFLAILTRAAARPTVLWLGVPVLALWANAHGGFVFGLGLLALWTIAFGAALGAAVRPQAVGALVLAGIVTAFATPFGVANLTHLFVVAGSPEWRRLAEWVPLFTADAAPLGHPWEAGLLAGSLAMLALGRLALGARRTATTERPAPPAARGLAWFDAATVVAVTIVAWRARGCVPLALLVMSPLLAAELAWWQRRLGRPWLIPLVALGAALAVGVAAPPLLRRYAAANPVFAGATVFGRMMDAPALPSGPAEFLRANSVAGRAYAAYEWEGYLRFTDTPVTVLIGGRADQVYDDATLRLHQDLVAGTKAARTALAERQVGLALVPLNSRYSAPLNGLVYDDGSPWTYAYCDGRHVVLVDTSHPDLAPLVAGLAAGTLRYPTPAIAATSRMMYLAAPESDATPETARAAAETAAHLAPTALAYAVLGDLALLDAAADKATRGYLAEERLRLAALATSEANAYEIAQARLAVTRVELALASRARDQPETTRAQGELTLRNEEMRRLLTTWAYGWNPDVF